MGTGRPMSDTPSLAATVEPTRQTSAADAAGNGLGWPVEREADVSRETFGEPVGLGWPA